MIELTEVPQLCSSASQSPAGTGSIEHCWQGSISHRVLPGLVRRAARLADCSHRRPLQGVGTGAQSGSSRPASRSNSKAMAAALAIAALIVASCRDDVDSVAPPVTSAASTSQPTNESTNQSSVAPATPSSNLITTPVSTPPTDPPVTPPPTPITVAATQPTAPPCLDGATAKALAEPAFPGVASVTVEVCQGVIAAGSGWYDNGDGFTVSYVNESGRWRFLAGSFGIRSVCDAVWSYDVSIDIGCGTNFRWPYGDYFSVPQLGVEGVRGSGCGGSGEIGEVIPDGVWNGYLIDEGDSVIAFDLACVYYGESAQPFIDEYLRTTPEEDRLDYMSNYWLINNGDRVRQVPRSPAYLHRWAEWTEQGCRDPGSIGDFATPQPSGMDGWLFIEGGQAVFLLTSCMYG